jgi:hypothetical protein
MTWTKGNKMQSQAQKGACFNPGFAFEKRKNFFPIKTFISQPLWNANFLGPSRLRDGGFYRTYLKQFHAHNKFMFKAT